MRHMSGQVSEDDQQDPDGPAGVLVSFRCSAELNEAFTQLAKAQDLTRSQLLRKLMRDYVAALRPKPKR